MTPEEKAFALETAKAIYDRLAGSDRQQYIQRAEQCAKYTIPSVFPKESDNASTKFTVGFQSLGARGTNNLSAKLMLALMPPNAPFFRLGVSEQALAAYVSQPDLRTNVEAALGKIERIITKYIESRQIRVTIMEALKVLIITGNGLLYLPPKTGGIKLYKLNSYVIQRDALGNVILIITRDRIAYAALPENVKTMVFQKNNSVKPEDTIDIYTHVRLEGENFVSYQEVEGERITGTENTVPRKVSPWIPLRMVKVDGENYGRSFVEEYLGDLMCLEGLSKAIAEMAAISATVKYAVNPNGITRVSRLEKTPNGGYFPGRKADIEPITLDKYADLQVSKAAKDDIESRLSYIFLLNSAVQRAGERVTAEEIRYVAGELEDTLGGIYSILSQELQVPLIRCISNQLQQIGEIPNMPEETVEPTITTGLEALGRGHDFNRIRTFLQECQAVPGASQWLKDRTILTMLATSLNIDIVDLIKSVEEFEAEQQQAQMMAMGEKVAPQLAAGFAQAQQQQ